MTTGALSSLAVLAATVALAACAAEPESDGQTAVVAGVTTDLAVGFDIDRLRVTTRIEGVVTRQQDLLHDDGDLHLPAELWVEGLADGSSVELVVEAFGGSATTPLLSRTAATRAAGGRTLFLPVPLALACVPPAAAPCSPDQTCIDGECRDPFVEPSGLADFDPAWMDLAADACKVPGSGPPAVVIGRGRGEYIDLAEGQAMAVEAGPQGGHHLWLGVRTRQLRQAKSVLTVRGHLPALATEVPPMTSVVTLHRAEAGLCEIFGVRFQVDRGIALDALIGEALEVEVSVEDETGDVGTATNSVIIATPRGRGPRFR